MHFRQAILTVDGKTYALQPDKSNSFEELYVDFQQAEVNGGRRWSVFLHPKQDIRLQKLELQFDMPMPAGTQFFANGYQSWSESRLHALDEPIPRLRRMARKHMGYSGDDRIAGIPRGRGHLHAWSYTYFKKPTATVLLGSLSERTGFSLFLYEQSTGIMTIRKDLDDLALSHSFPGLDIWIGESTEKDVFDAWFKTMEQPKPDVPHNLGWTSWYQHFTNISAEILEHNLEQLHTSGLPFQTFQIDDGWQTAVGDWLSIKPAIPRGMADMAAKIKDKNMVPGLWLAPFVASAKSGLARKHPDWLLKDAQGKPIRVGWNPYWGGWYYALDFYHNGVRDYLSGVFHTVLDKWGYHLLKIDFLFAVCIAPPTGKTRGAVMWEAMEFLRTQVGHRQVLACGVPLGACFGQVAYCRVGGDIHTAWEHNLLRWLRHRERVSSIAALRSVLGRWQLNGRAFVNDPDVFILRNKGQQLSPEQQHTILIVNVLLGGVLFHSDDLGDYAPEQMTELEAALEFQPSRVSQVLPLAKDLYRIDFESDTGRFTAYCNLRAKKAVIPHVLELEPYETMVFKANP